VAHRLAVGRGCLDDADDRHPFFALVGVKTAYMLAVKRTSLLWGIVLGAWWLGEPDLCRNLLAGGVMVAGVALIALA
jgi:hypothetical protein